MFDYRTPQYIIRDPQLFKQIATKDFDNFVDHSSVHGSGDDLWGNGLMFLKGEKWRSKRATLSPVFTPSKIRQMFDLATEYLDDVVHHFSKRVENGEQINLEIKDFFSRYTNDVIAKSIHSLSQKFNFIWLFLGIRNMCLWSQSQFI